MDRFKRAVFTLAAAALLVPPEALSQSPAGPPLRVWASQATPLRHQFPPGVAVKPDGGLVVIWYEEAPGGGSSPRKLLIRGFSVEDESLGEPSTLADDRRTGCCLGGSVAGNEAGHLVVALGHTGLNARRYGFSAGPRDLRLDTSEAYFAETPHGVALDARGNFVVVWQSQGQEATDIGESGVRGRLVDFRGDPLGPELHVNTRRRGNQDEPSVSMSSQTGAFVVVWSSDPNGSARQVAGQLFAPGGARVGGEFRLGSVIPGFWRTHPKVAMAPDGTFVVVWQEPDLEDPCDDCLTIFGQRFTAAGQPLGPQWRISEGFVGGQQFPNLAMDAKGNFVVTWIGHPVLGVAMARLYRANGVPAGAPVPLHQVLPYEGAMVAFGWNGTFAVTWREWVRYPPKNFARRFSASPGDEPCLFRQGVLACDTGRTGGVAEVRHRFGGPGDIGLLGDIDGDGRADPCVFRNGRFLCDTAHDYGTAELKERFGRSGDTPLLGDVDGNGRADACVYREGRFLCDSAHDGAVHEDIRLGEPGDVPLLGDVNDDGRADPCLFRAGRFLCDVNHDATLDLEIRFGRVGDIPLLMDFDTDGTVEPCVYHAGELLCDTGHDGGAAEATLIFGDGNGVPLAGNLDGL